MKSKKTPFLMIFVWLIAIIFWQLIQFSQEAGMEDRQNSQYDDIIITFVVGILFGINFSIINWILHKKKRSVNRLSYGGLIFIYALVHLVSFFITMLVILLVLGMIEGGADTLMFEFVWSIDMLRIYLYTYVVSIGIFLTRIINQKFGRGILKDLILGKYRKPKEQNQIFLFMDLKSSTSYAEKLGHIKYSQLIQDCFADLTPAAIDNQARVYQYVGDEVVLTWPYQKGIDEARCVNLFYQFKQIINEKAAYYLVNYGLIPEFKAGLNGGVLMAAEVGVVKRSIAYHGDVINTASRLQHLCGEMNKEFLISQSIVNDLPESLSVKYQFVEKRKLKGKKKMVGIFAPLQIN